MTRCPVCYSDIEDFESECPNCGYVKKDKIDTSHNETKKEKKTYLKKVKKIVVWLLFAIYILLFLYRSYRFFDRMGFNFELLFKNEETVDVIETGPFQDYAFSYYGIIEKVGNDYRELRNWVYEFDENANESNFEDCTFKIKDSKLVEAILPVRFTYKGIEFSKTYYYFDPGRTNETHTIISAVFDPTIEENITYFLEVVGTYEVEIKQGFDSYLDNKDILDVEKDYIYPINKNSLTIRPTNESYIHLFLSYD